VYLQTTVHIYLLLSERVNRTFVLQSKKGVQNWTYNNLSSGPCRVSRCDAVAIVEPIRPPCRTDGNERWLGESVFGDARMDSGWGRTFLDSLDCIRMGCPTASASSPPQAFNYVVIVILARRNSMWGVGAGVTIGVFWDSLNLFVTHLMPAGAVAFRLFVHTGQVRRPETTMVALGGIGHFVFIIACVAALFDQTTKDRNWWKFVGGGACTLVCFFLIIAVARPRKLSKIVVPPHPSVSGGAVLECWPDCEKTRLRGQQITTGASPKERLSFDELSPMHSASEE
jgi:hypothetical protein